MPHQFLIHLLFLFLLFYFKDFVKLMLTCFNCWCVSMSHQLIEMSLVIMWGILGFNAHVFCYYILYRYVLRTLSLINALPNKKISSNLRMGYLYISTPVKVQGEEELIGWIESNLLSTAKHFIRSCFFSANTKKIKII